MKCVKLSFSLLELVICLGILAVLSSILLENFADVKARECESHTFERGNRVREAVKGSELPGGIGGFLSDMGRFPSVYIPEEGDGNGGRRLAQLYDPSIWYSSSGTGALRRRLRISPYEIRDICRYPGGTTFPADDSGILLPYPEVVFYGGWSGPYISISDPVGGSFYDGWGNSWKIISDYSLHVSGGRLEENSSIVKIYAAAAEIDALRDVSGNRYFRMDGIVSYGANDTADTGTDVAAADGDQKFLFPHNMDNHGRENLAGLQLSLEIRDADSGDWIKMPSVSFWESGKNYARGAVAAFSGSVYSCIEEHESCTSFEAGKWIDLASATAYTAAVHGAAGYSGICIYENGLYLRTASHGETAFTPSNWLRISGVGEIPDSLSLMIFTPVMQGTYNQRVVQPGYYHFYRNASGSNEHGVKPLYGASSPSADVDCLGDTTTEYSSGDDYNGRYLIAEDHSGAAWNEYSIERLIPGNRRILCIAYCSRTGSCYMSQVEWLSLRPGENQFTLRLERKR